MSVQRPYEPVYYNLSSTTPLYDRHHAGRYDDTNAVNSSNTLFVWGLPDDVNAREIKNLFDRRHGFEYCEIKNTGRGNQIVAVAKFVNHPSALAALHDLNGLKYDPQTGSTLHVELARSNSRRVNKPGYSETAEPSDPNKDAYTESDHRTHVDTDNITGAAETMSVVDNLLLKDKLDDTNFVDWYRHLRIVLRHKKMLYVLENPVPKEPPANATKASMDAWIKHMDDASQVACLMLATMIPDLQRDFEHVSAYEMLNRLKDMSRRQARRERYETMKALVRCKMTEGSCVSSHVLKMKSYIEKLETLGSPLSNEHATYMILGSLPNSYDEFIQNFFTNNWEMSIFDLHRVLKIDEKNKKTKSSQVLTIREGRIMKSQAKAKGKDKSQKVVPAKQVSKTKERPAKDDICFHCGKVGHWKRNCPVYLEELKERKAREGSSN